jgi:hypothetical protein
MKMASEKRIIMEVKNGVKENIVVETEKLNKRGKLLSPDQLLQMTLPPPLTVWIARWWADHNATKAAV